MAYSRPSSAPMFTTFTDLAAERSEDTGVDPIIGHPGANQFLGDSANHHDGQSTLGPRGNRVQDGALSLLGTHSVVGRPDKANPYGRQDG